MFKTYIDSLFMAVFFDLNSEKSRAYSNHILMLLFLNLALGIKIDAFVEVGAFKAEASRFIRKHLKEADIWALEASPYNYEAVSKVIDWSALNIYYLHKACSDIHNGQIDFYLQHEFQGQPVEDIRGNDSMLKRVQDGFSYKKVSVPTVTLDGLLSEKSATKIALWIDVEGAADKVLTGAEASLENTAVIMIELEDEAKWQGQALSTDIIDRLKDKGFHMIARDFEYATQFNAVFLAEALLDDTVTANAVRFYASGLRKGLEDSLKPNIKEA